MFWFFIVGHKRYVRDTVSKISSLISSNIPALTCLNMPVLSLDMFYATIIDVANYCGVHTICISCQVQLFWALCYMSNNVIMNTTCIWLNSKISKTLRLMALSFFNPVPPYKVLPGIWQWWTPLLLLDRRTRTRGSGHVCHNTKHSICIFFVQSCIWLWSEFVLYNKNYTVT